MTNISGQMLGDISRKLHGALSAVSKNVCFQPLGKAIFDAIEDAGIPLDRLQIPMMRQLGFRHPLFGVIVITVYRGEAPNIRYVSHDDFDKRVQWIEESTPFRGVLKVPGRVERFDLEKSRSEFEVFEELLEHGMEHYAVTSLELANGSIQPFSMAARPEHPFPDDLEERLQILNPQLAISLSAAYQIHVSRTVAETYLGKGTAERVLIGEIRRGSYSRITAGIAFCDIRGFTRMSEEIGALETVKRVNLAFETLEKPLVEGGGEILKFIGDAMLVIFPHGENEDTCSMVGRLVAATQKAIEAVHELRATGQADLEVGIGLHVGEVLYGNVGTPERLDFTVMGQAVNLAARLEGYCSSSKVPLAASDAVGREIASLVPLGVEQFKGVSEPVQVYGLP